MYNCIVEQLKRINMEFTHDELFEQFLDKVNVDRNTESYRKLLKYRKEKIEDV